MLRFVARSRHHIPALSARFNSGGAASGGGGGGGGGRGVEAAGFLAIYGFFGLGHKIATGGWPGEVKVDEDSLREEIVQFVGPPGKPICQPPIDWNVQGFSRSSYRLYFDENGHVYGFGRDADGSFIVKDGFYNPNTFRVAWYEKGVAQTIVVGTCTNDQKWNMECAYNCRNAATDVIGSLPLVEGAGSQHLASGIDATYVPSKQSLPPSLRMDLEKADKRQLIKFGIAALHFPFHFGQWQYDKTAARQEFDEHIKSLRERGCT